MINQSDTPIKIDSSVVAGITTMVIYLAAIADVRASSDADYSFVIDSDWHNCQQISTDYQEVYAFETPSFYVNICQKDEAYFYSGEAKQKEMNSMNSIFIPAISLEHKRGFQAQNGNISYVVILPFSQQSNLESADTTPAEAILTIKRNGRLVAVESSLHKYCHQPKAIAFDKIKLNPQSDYQLATIPSQHDLGWNWLSNESSRSLPIEIFSSNSRFDFYRIDGKLHRLATCN